MHLRTAGVSVAAVALGCTHPSLGRSRESPCASSAGSSVSKGRGGGWGM